jgi:hypothetical protein
MRLRERKHHRQRRDIFDESYDALTLVVTADAVVATKQDNRLAMFCTSCGHEQI